jgi:hypothetical protein
MVSFFNSFALALKCPKLREAKADPTHDDSFPLQCWISPASQRPDQRDLHYSSPGASHQHVQSQRKTALGPKPFRCYLNVTLEAKAPFLNATLRSLGVNDRINPPDSVARLRGEPLVSASVTRFSPTVFC